MKCPNCKADMEQDDWGDCRVQTLTGEEYVPPEALYHCEECGLEAGWRRGNALEVIFDPRTRLYSSEKDFYEGWVS